MSELENTQKRPVGIEEAAHSQTHTPGPHEVKTHAMSRWSGFLTPSVDLAQQAAGRGH